MSTRDPDGPSSPAAFGSLQPQSEAASELAARAADAAAAAEDEEAKRDADVSRALAKKAADDKADLEASQRAPVGLTDTSRFFGLVFTGLAAAACVIGLALETRDMPWRYAFAGAAVWALVLGAHSLDFALWKKRLPFALEGWQRITGTFSSDRHRAPILQWSIRIDLRDRTREGRAARKQTLEILVSRANALLQKDSDFKDVPKHKWRVDADGDSCTGSGTRSFYATRFFEKWLRNDVRLLAKIAGVERVRVDAKYTGDSVWVSSD